MGGYYPLEYKNLDEFDVGIIELKEELEEDYGYLGIDATKHHLRSVSKVEVCGYPIDKCEDDVKLLRPPASDEDSF